MARPRTESPEIRRTKILEAAREVLIHKGYQDFRMSDVADQAKIAIGTLYLYFKDKLDIYAGVFIDLLDRLDLRLEQAIQDKKGIEALREIAHTMLSFIDEQQDFFSQFTGDHPAFSQSDAGLKLEESFRVFLKIISRPIKEAVKEGQLRKEDASFVGVHLTFLVRMFIVWKILARSKEPLSSKTDDLMRLFLRGMGQ